MKTASNYKVIARGLPLVLLGALSVPAAVAEDASDGAVATDIRLAAAGRNDAATSQQSVDSAPRDAEESAARDDFDGNQALKDAWLLGKVETALALNPHLNPFAIDTDVTGGVAKLSGQVETEIDRELAGEVTLSVEGIVDVENELAVSGEARRADAPAEGEFWQRVEDATITARVKSKLLANSRTGGLAIDITTEHNKVSLDGTVDSDEEKNLAELLARNTSGVAGVENRLQVN